MTWLEYLRASHCLSCWYLYWQHPYRTWSCSVVIVEAWMVTVCIQISNWALLSSGSCGRCPISSIHSIDVHGWGNQHLCQDQWLAKRCLPLAGDAQVWSAVGCCSLAEDTGLLWNTSLDKKWQEGANWLQMKTRKYQEIPENQHWTADLSSQVMYNATINACKGERWQIALSLLFELERPLFSMFFHWIHGCHGYLWNQKTCSASWEICREALEKDDISFNSSIGAAKNHWPLAMLFFVEAQDRTMIRWGPVLAWNVRDDISGDSSEEIRPLVQKQHNCGVLTCSLKKHQLKSAVMLPATTFLVSLCFSLQLYYIIL